MKDQPVLMDKVYEKAFRRDFGGKKPPYQVGDMLYVRETWRLFSSHNECACYDDCQCSSYHGRPMYYADHLDDESKWRPSIHMPKKYARLWLEVVKVRAERLQEIKEWDIAKEGCPQIELATGLRIQWFRDLWNSIYGKKYPWDSNPWVWVYDFKVVKL